MGDVSNKKKYLDRRFHQIKNIILRRPRNCYSYQEAYPYFVDIKTDSKEDFIPTIIPNWDHSPRSTGKGVIFHNSTPSLFKKHIKQIFNLLKTKSPNNQYVFLKSWNEWGEGNYMEPDLKWGKEYIKTLREEIDKYNKENE